eukprot:scaffold64665_cov61-Phaeocystis_antarctica.AAC.2
MQRHIVRRDMFAIAGLQNAASYRRQRFSAENRLPCIPLKLPTPSQGKNRISRLHRNGHQPHERTCFRPHPRQTLSLAKVYALRHRPALHAHRRARQGRVHRTAKLCRDGYQRTFSSWPGVLAAPPPRGPGPGAHASPR